MGSPSGIKMNWPLVAIALAVIGVPMGVALIQDLGKDSDDEEILARIGRVDDITAEDDSIPDEPRLESADDLAGRWQEPAMDQAFFDEVFLGGPEDTGPALRGPLAGLRWDAAAVDEPDLSRWPRASAEIVPGRYLDRMEAIELSFPDDGTAARVFESRWGRPLLMVGADDLARRIWTDPQARLRLVLEQHDGSARAMFSPFIPAADYIGRDGLFAFESSPILGSAGSQLVVKYGAAYHDDALHDAVHIECPGIEVSEHPADCAVEFSRGKAARLTVRIDHGLDPDGGPRLFDALKSRLGAVRQQAGDEHGNTWTFDRGITVTQVAGTAAITVERLAR